MYVLLFYVLLFIFGLFVGSFLNLVADRVVIGEQIWRGRSHCDFCKTVLKIRDLIPVFSFLTSRGKCRYCEQKLSLSYPLSELFTGCLFVLAGVSSGILAGLPYSSGVALDPHRLFFFTYLLVVFSFYAVIFLADAKYQIIPTKVLVFGVVFVLVARILFFGLSWATLISTGGLVAFFWLLFAITRGRGMGFGDVRLALLIGLFNDWPYNVLGIFGAFVLGSVFSIFLMVLGKKGMKDKIAFGPFMILGSLLAVIFGDVFLMWWLY